LKYLPLVWAALRRKPVRAIMTLLSVTVAFTLFGMMIGFRATITAAEESAHTDRIWTVPRFGRARMPDAMAKEIAALPGVKDVTNMSYLNGYVGEPTNRVGIAFFDDEYGRIFPELGPSLEQWDLMRHDRGIIVMSRKQAERFHKKVGDLFTMTSNEVHRADGANTWTLKVGAIGEEYDLNPGGYIYGNYDFYDQAVSRDDQGKTAEVDLLIADPRQADAIAARIDRLFANSSSPTQSWTEVMAFNPANNFGGLDLFGLTEDVALAGLVMILFLTANVIAQSVRERLPEFATLKTMGFSDSALVGLVMLEAGLPCVIGAAAGIALSGVVGRFIPAFFPPGFGFPMPTISPMVMLWAALSALALAFASAALPALRLRRMDIATALSGRA
jgi:putative ABC transport system permease protein